MGNLKFKPKKNADLVRMSAMIKSVNDAIALGVISFEKNAECYIFPEILVGKDDDYKSNFCKNLLTYHRIHSGEQPEETRNTVLGVYNKSTSKLIFTYSDRTGLSVLF